MTAERSALASLLRGYRAVSGLTQEELAERAQVSARTISDVERGLRSTIYRDTAERLAAALDLGDEDRERFRSAARGSRGPAGGSGAVPRPPTRLIGREHELAVVHDKLSDPHVQLVTLTGPGGVGKTRIALEAARGASNDFPGGVFFVSLASTRDPDLLLSIFASSLHAGPLGDPSIEDLARSLGERRILLVIDTFEHLLAAAPIVSDLLAACEGMTVLATSRERLRLRGEHEIPIVGLPVPSEVGSDGPKDLGGYPAAALFVERAQAALPDLVIDETAARVVAEICRRLNGLPLAIELAAARVKHVSLPALCDSLRKRLDVLTEGPRDLPPRQQTMRDTVRWSYELLEAEQQRVFRILSVFEDGWMIEAARALCPDDDVLIVVSALVDKSLVTVSDAAGDRQRYVMLDVIREFAVEMLEDPGEAEASAASHAQYFLSLAEEAEAGLGTARQEAWYARMSAENDNMRAASRWMLQHEDAERALRLSGALWQFWRVDGRLAEGRKWLREGLAFGGSVDPRVLAKALWGASWLAFHSGDFDDAEELSAELEPLARAIDDPGISRNALTVRGIVALARGQLDDATSRLRECVEICRGLGPDWYLATSLLNLGMASMHGGDPAAADPFLAEAHALYEHIGDERFAARAICYMGHAFLRRGDIGAARERFVVSLGLQRDRGDLQGIAEGLEAMSALLASEGHADRAARAAGAAERIREDIAARPFPFDRSTIESSLARARGSVDEETWATWLDEGRVMPLDLAIAVALRSEV